MDSTFETSRVQFLLYTFLVFDDHRSGFSSAWIITNRETEEYITKFMEALKCNIQLHSPTFTPTYFVVDDNKQHVMPLGNFLLLKFFLCIQCSLPYIYFVHFFAYSAIYK